MGANAPGGPPRGYGPRGMAPTYQAPTLPSAAAPQAQPPRMGPPGGMPAPMAGNDPRIGDPRTGPTLPPQASPQAVAAVARAMQMGQPSVAAAPNLPPQAAPQALANMGGGGAPIGAPFGMPAEAGLARAPMMTQLQADPRAREMLAALLARR